MVDLLKTKDLKRKIVNFDLNSKNRILLVSLKRNITDSEVENLGAKFYDQNENLKENEFNLNSDTIPNNAKKIVGYFLHGLKLKSYKFEKYKTKKNKKNIIINVIGKNIPAMKDQVKFKSIEN